MKAKIRVEFLAKEFITTFDEDQLRDELHKCSAKLKINSTAIGNEVHYILVCDVQRCTRQELGIAFRLIDEFSTTRTSKIYVVQTGNFQNKKFLFVMPAAGVSSRNAYIAYLNDKLKEMDTKLRAELARLEELKA